MHVDVFLSYKWMWWWLRQYHNGCVLICFCDADECCLFTGNIIFDVFMYVCDINECDILSVYWDPQAISDLMYFCNMNECGIFIGNALDVHWCTFVIKTRNMSIGNEKSLCVNPTDT